MLPEGKNNFLKIMIRHLILKNFNKAFMMNFYSRVILKATMIHKKFSIFVETIQ